MSGNYLIRYLTVAFVFFCFSCAQPKYIEETPENGSNGGMDESSTSCNIQFNISKLCLSWKWEKKPTKDDPGSLIFKTYRLNQYDQSAIMEDLSSAPTVQLWMPDMGHGSLPTTTQRLDLGTYRATNVLFIMPGDWQIKFQTKPDGTAVHDEAIVDLSI